MDDDSTHALDPDLGAQDDTDLGQGTDAFGLYPQGPHDDHPHPLDDDDDVHGHHHHHHHHHHHLHQHGHEQDLGDHQAILDALPDPPGPQTDDGLLSHGGQGPASSSATATINLANPNELDPNDPNDSSSSSKARRQPTIPIACGRCRRQKLKCSGGLPCVRCTKKGLPPGVEGGCEYAPEVRRRGLGRKNRKNDVGGPGGGGGGLVGSSGGANGGTASAYGQDANGQTYEMQAGPNDFDPSPYHLHQHQQDLADQQNADAGPSTYVASPHDDVPPAAGDANESVIDPSLAAASLPLTEPSSNPTDPDGHPRQDASLPSAGRREVDSGAFAGGPPHEGGEADHDGELNMPFAMDLLDFSKLSADELGLLGAAASHSLPSLTNSTSHDASDPSRSIYPHPRRPSTPSHAPSPPPPTPPPPPSSSTRQEGQGSISTPGGSSSQKKPVPPKTAIACARCRSQKLRCPTPPPGPCERCVKAGRQGECSYAAEVRRRGGSKRKRIEAEGGLLIGMEGRSGAGASGKKGKQQQTAGGGGGPLSTSASSSNLHAIGEVDHSHGMSHEEEMQSEEAAGNVYEAYTHEEPAYVSHQPDELQLPSGEGHLDNSTMEGTYGHDRLSSPSRAAERTGDVVEEQEYVHQDASIGQEEVQESGRTYDSAFREMQAALALNKSGPEEVGGEGELRPATGEEREGEEVDVSL